MIRVLFFGKVADLMGRRELDLEVTAEPLRLYALRARLFDTGGVDEALAARILMSVNKDIIRDDRLLQGGDEVAFFSAFSGG